MKINTVGADSISARANIEFAPTNKKLRSKIK